MELRNESVFLPVPRQYRILHISDVHFSARTAHEQNLRVTDRILALARSCADVDAVCITGDLVSRKCTPQSLDDAVQLVQRLRTALPGSEILFSMGNHEMDLPADVRAALCRRIRGTGAAVLDNAVYETSCGICFAGLTLPGDVYRLPNGSYIGLSTITSGMVENCFGGSCPHKPCVLLAHTPLGFSAYAAWGADLVLSGHVHGGIIRIGKIGLLSPERRFFPRYTKGMFHKNGCTMNVSAGIGKLRIHNPAEVICLDLLPKEAKA